MIGTRWVAIVALLTSLPICGEAQRSRRAGRASSGSSAIAIRAEMAAVLLQSRRYDEAADEYRILLAHDAFNMSYHMGLARALAWGGRFDEAERELAWISARRPGDPAVEALLLSARKELEPSSNEAAQWLSQRRTLDYRLIYARALARERRVSEARAQLDTLLLQRPSAALLVERAYVNLDRRDYAGVETDVSASLAMGPSAPAYLLLSELERSRGNYASARRAQERARRLPHDDLDLATHAAQLARDERPPVAFMPDVTEPLGWLSTNSSTHDNLGVNFSTLALRHGARLPQRWDASVGVTANRFASRGTEISAAPLQPAANGALGADVALSREATHGAFQARVRARAGFLYHETTDALPDAGLATTVFHNAWGIGADLSTGPAYASLLTLGAYLPLEGTGSQLREQSVRVSLAGPIARADVAVSQEISAFSDDNMRRTLQGFARLPLQPHVALVYAGSSVSFAHPSLLYWDPERYVSHGAGLELRANRARGLSSAARVLPGFAFGTERVHDSSTRGVPTRETQVFQLSGGVELGYRADAWEISAGASYGTGRTGDYQRLDGSLQMRIAR